MTIETAVVMWLFGGLWSRWTLPFKIVTPILHVVFSIAQLWGAIIFRRMWKNQKRLLAEEEQAKAVAHMEEASLSGREEREQKLPQTTMQYV